MFPLTKEKNLLYNEICSTPGFCSKFSSSNNYANNTLLHIYQPRIFQKLQFVVRTDPCYDPWSMVHLPDVISNWRKIDDNKDYLLKEAIKQKMKNEHLSADKAGCS